MTKFGGQHAHRVFLPQALGGDEFLRVTWHEHNGVFVFSQWERERCVAATPVRVDQLGDLGTMIVTAVGEEMRKAASTPSWDAPARDGVVHLGRELPA